MLFNEPKLLKFLQEQQSAGRNDVSVLFNEPKLLKFYRVRDGRIVVHGFSALQRAEIAEIAYAVLKARVLLRFQCSSTSRNC